MEITPFLGIGDLIILKKITKVLNINLEKIIISNNLINNYREYPNKFRKFINEFIKILFPNILVQEMAKPNLQPLNERLYEYIDNFYINNDIDFPKIEINYNDYIIFHTKVRLDGQMEKFINEDLNILNNFFKNFQTDKKIILLGEKFIENCCEKEVHNIISIYENLLFLKNNNNIIDLTHDTLYSGQDDFNKFIFDVNLIINAECNIVCSIGGNFCLPQAFSKNNIVFISNYKHKIIERLLINNKSIHNDVFNFINEIQQLFSNNYKSAFILTHLGLGDNITSIPIVRYLREKYSKVKVVCKKQYLENLKSFYNDDQNIEFIPVNGDKDISPLLNIDSFNFYSKNCDNYIVGLHLTKHHSFNYLPFNFYDDLNLSYSIFWNYFKISNHINNNFNELLKNIPYIFVHNTTNTTQELFSSQDIEKHFNISKNNILFINSNKNMYDKEHEYYNLAEKFVNLKLIEYVEIIKNGLKILLTDSSIFCLSIHLEIKTDECYVISRFGDSYDYIWNKEFGYDSEKYKNMKKFKNLNFNK